MLLHLRWFPPRSTAGSIFLSLPRFLFHPSFSSFSSFSFLFHCVASTTDHFPSSASSSSLLSSPFFLAQSPLPLYSYRYSFLPDISETRLRTANFTSWIIYNSTGGIVHGAYLIIAISNNFNRY